MRVLGAFVVASLLASAAAAQTYDPQKGASPLVLLQVPPDGLGYYRARQQAQDLYDRQKFADALPLAEQVAKDYPRDPENWMLLGRIQRSLGKHLEAAASFEKAGPLIGWGLQFPNGYRMAIETLKAGDRKKALEILRWTIFEQHGFWRNELYDWEDFATLKNDREFLDLIGHPDTTGWSREKGWRFDLDYFREELARTNPDYRGRAFPAEFERRYQALYNAIGHSTDEQMFFALRQAVAELHQGHMSFWPFPRTRYLPLRLYAFPEGIYVLDADAAHKDLVGARVTRIGSLAAEEAWRRESTANSADGDMEHIWDVFRLIEVASLVGMGAVASQDDVPLTVEMRDGRRREVVVGSVATEPPNEQNARWDRLMAPPGVTAPLYLSDMKSVFWHKPLPEHHALYVQVNNIDDMPNEKLADYGKRLWGVMGDSGARNLIVDLRHDNGGNTYLYTELLRSITAFSRIEGHKVYVLIGRRTYSATANFITDLERLARPVFVGEASGECCDLHGDPQELELPYTHIRIEATEVLWQYSTPGDRRREMSPQVPVQLHVADYFAGRDPALEAAFKLMD
ncbi:MAG: tetratricopeptide repeat protein [Alphaproteobacteria bacterium]|nr:tetratricopeptide repeat protein [Alphaproteobacteria bacterium]